jgi:hypothetical protein
LSLKTKVDDLSVVCPQNYWNGFLRFGLKTCGDGISGLASKLVATVFSAWSQNWWRRFLLIWPQNWWWISWFSLKTKVVLGFPVWASKSATTVW